MKPQGKADRDRGAVGLHLHREHECGADGTRSRGRGGGLQEPLRRGTCFPHEQDSPTGSAPVCVQRGLRARPCLPVHAGLLRGMAHAATAGPAALSGRRSGRSACAARHPGRTSESLQCPRLFRARNNHETIGTSGPRRRSPACMGRRSAQRRAFLDASHPQRFPFPGARSCQGIRESERTVASVAPGRFPKSPATTLTSSPRTAAWPYFARQALPTVYRSLRREKKRDDDSSYDSSLTLSARPATLATAPSIRCKCRRANRPPNHSQPSPPDPSCQTSAAGWCWHAWRAAIRRSYSRCRAIKCSGLPGCNCI